MDRRNEQQTTLENEKQYQSWKKELQQLESIDWESGDAPDPEYIAHRIQCLRADISSYEEVHSIIKASGVTEKMDDATYWNTIAVYYDEMNGDM